MTDAHWDQAPRRVIATQLHLLSCDAHTIVRVFDQFTEPGALAMGTDLLSSYGAAPHGVRVDDGPDYIVGGFRSVPLLVRRGYSEESKERYEIRQPALGRHYGQDIGAMAGALIVPDAADRPDRIVLDVDKGSLPDLRYTIPMTPIDEGLLKELFGKRKERRQ